MKAGQDVRREGAEAAAEIEQPVDVLLDIGDGDKKVIEQRLLDDSEVFMGKLLSRVDVGQYGTEWRIQRLDDDAH
jgi:hypothetical protein